MFILTIILVVITFGLLYLHWVQTRSRFAKLINKFPSNPYIPLFGHVLQFSGKPDKFFAQIRSRFSKYKETTKLWLGYYGTLHIVTADDAEIILSSVKYIDKSIIYRFLKPWLGTGLLTSEGTKWHNRRKLLTPTFHFNILKRFVEIFGEHSDNFVSQLKKENNNSNIINIIPIIKHATLTSICETAMGTKLNDTNKEQKEYLDTLNLVGPALLQRGISPLLYTDFIYYLCPSGWAFKKNVDKLHKFTNDVITERERTFEAGDDEQSMPNQEDGVKKKRLAMLDLLISAKVNRNEIDHEGICEEVDTFMFEGHDTTSMALCFALMTLAQHEDVQEKIIAELDNIFGQDTRGANCDDLQNMKYLELCLKECLRLYPSVPIISREIYQDVQLTHNVAPAGTMFAIHIFQIHRDPKYYPDPEKFDPNRFSPENSKGRNPYAYIPFSAGPRNCIGQRYAMLELKSIVSAVFRNFTLQSVSTEKDICMIFDIVLRVEGPINVKFIPRN